MSLRLFDLMTETKTTQTQLSQAIGVSQGNISDWKSGRSFPKGDVLSRLADYFGVTTDYLLGRTDQKEMSAAEGWDGLSEPEKHLISLYQDLNDEGQSKLLDYADDLIATDKIQLS